MVSMKDPATGQMINPENGLPVTPQTAAAPAQAARPRVPAKSDPAVLKIQQDLIAKGAKIKADGVMGPATQAAQKQFGQGAKPAPAVPGKAAPAGGATSTMGAIDPATNMPATPYAESVYKEDQALARIVSLARG
jgi:peptidoglycan hydrolase-like protein with peptidoglycan-binding domain